MPEPIQRVVLTHVQVPFKEPFRISGGVVDLKDGILVEVETAGGLVGLGESSPMAATFGYSADTPEGCWAELTQTIAPSLLGREIDSDDDIAAISNLWKSCSRFAVAGAETALWDLLGQQRKECIAEWLGVADERIDQGVESGLAIGLYPTIIDLIQRIEAHLEEGYTRVKIKIAPGQDLDLVQAVRRHFGEIELMVDANGAYTAADIPHLARLDEFDLLMIEQPMAPADIEASARLQAAISTPVCIDESADTVESAIRALDRGAAKIVNLKLQRLGGFGPARALHDLCLGRGVACWVGTMPELGIGQAHGLHLAALPNCRYPSDLEPSTRWFVDDIVVPALEMAAPGKLRVPTRPGLGCQLDAARVRRYQAQRIEFVAPRA